MLGAFKDWFHLHYQPLKDFVPSIVALLGLGLTAVIAIAGFKSFGRWKREKIEERRIEVALDALAIAYEARFRFESIRSRFTRKHEYADIDEPFEGRYVCRDYASRGSKIAGMQFSREWTTIMNSLSEYST